MSVTTGSGERFEFGLVIFLSAAGGAVLCGVLAFYLLKAIWTSRRR
ncbi:hypothetical protein [Microvirga sp. Mcv34]|nr:hypothetical protein [Microvirga sp. Mcv34]